MKNKSLNFAYCIFMLVFVYASKAELYESDKGSPVLQISNDLHLDISLDKGEYDRLSIVLESGVAGINESLKKSLIDCITAPASQGIFSDNRKVCRVPIYSNDAPKDASYPLAIMSPVNGSGQINISVFKSLFKTFYKRIIVVSSGATVFFHGESIENGGLDIDLDRVGDGAEYLFFGGVNNASVTADRETPEWLRNTLSESYEKLDSAYRAKSEINNDKNRKMYIHFDSSSSENYWWGDVDDFGNISLRFYGVSWKKEDDQAKMSVIKFLAHEIFHVYYPANKQLPRWIYEGGAEAYSTALLYSLRYLNDDDVKLVTINKVNECHRSLLMRKYSIVGYGDFDRFPYSCGYFANFEYGKNTDSYQKYFWMNIDLFTPFEIWRKVASESTPTEKSFWTAKRPGSFDGLIRGIISGDLNSLHQLVINSTNGFQRGLDDQGIALKNHAGLADNIGIEGEFESYLPIDVEGAIGENRTETKHR